MVGTTEHFVFSLDPDLTPSLLTASRGLNSPLKNQVCLTAPFVEHCILLVILVASRCREHGSYQPYDTWYNKSHSFR